MKLTSKLRRDWHYYAFAIGLKQKDGKPMPSGW